MYLSGIETFICHGEIEFNRVYFLRFCTKYYTWFSKYAIELKWHCLWQMPQKPCLHPSVPHGFSPVYHMVLVQCTTWVWSSVPHGFGPVFHMVLVQCSWTQLQNSWLDPFSFSLKIESIHSKQGLTTASVVCSNCMVWEFGMHLFVGWYAEYRLIMLNPFPNKPWFLHVCSTLSLLKHWGKRRNCW